MRSIIVFSVLILMLALLAYFQISRGKIDHPVAVTADAATTGSDKALKSTTSTSGRSAPTPAPATATGEKKAKAPTPRPVEAETPPKPLPPPMKRPLKIAGFGWELLAPGIVANDGLKSGKKSLFAKHKLSVELSAHTSIEAIESAIARGGEDKLGADIGVMPLPTFVASYEQLNALRPQIFFVVGWSRGRHGLMASPKASLRRPPRGRTIDLLGKPRSSSTFFSLFLLELAGVPLSKVRLVSPTSKEENKKLELKWINRPNPFGERERFVYTVVDPSDKRISKAPFAAAERPLPPSAQIHDRKFIVTTADAGELIPIVAVAPREFIKAHQRALTILARTWLEGNELYLADVPKTARKIAAAQDTPHALELIKLLGQVEPATLLDNTRLLALSGRSAATLETLFARCWNIWRKVGVVSSTSPDAAPLAPGSVAALVRATPELTDAQATPTKLKPSRSVPVQSMLTYHPPYRRWNETNARELTNQLGFLASVFHRALFRVSVRGKLDRSESLIKMTQQRFELNQPQRLTAFKRTKGKLVAVELLTKN